MNTNLRRCGMLGRLVLALALCATGWAASEKVLYRFHGKDGNGPANVTVGPEDALYGASVEGGTNSCSGASFGCGVVFRLTRGAGGTWHETVLHDFAGTDGWFPNGALVADKAGNLYGTTVHGGPDGCSGLGCGVAFELERGGGGQWTFKVLHYFFQTYGDGCAPYGGLIFDSAGSLYGTASGCGNTSACEGGCGVVFKLSPEGKGNWTETVLYSFSGKDGEWPFAPLIFDSSGELYGTAEHGGDYGGGTVFRLSQRDGQWSEETLHSFSFDTRDGYEPTYGLIFDSSGDLYGTTTFGGTKGQQGWGTAFRLTPTGAGKWKETVLHSFDRDRLGGGFVSSGLTLDAEANAYGSAGEGGKYGGGVVFKLMPLAKGRWGEAVLHSFGNGNDGSGPIGNLVFDSSGHLLGAASSGGYTGGSCGVKYGCGVVFEVTP